MGDGQLMSWRPHVHASVVQHKILYMDKLASHPHAGGRVEEMAALDEALTDRTTAHLLIEPSELVLGLSDGRQQDSER